MALGTELAGDFWVGRTKLSRIFPGNFRMAGKCYEFLQSLSANYPVKPGFTRVMRKVPLKEIDGLIRWCPAQLVFPV